MRTGERVSLGEAGNSVMLKKTPCCKRKMNSLIPAGQERLTEEPLKLSAAAVPRFFFLIKNENPAIQQIILRVHFLKEMFPVYTCIRSARTAALKAFSSLYLHLVHLISGERILLLQ